MPSSPPPAGTGPEEAEMVSGEVPLPLVAADTGAGGEGGAPSVPEEEADGSGGGEEGDGMDEDEDGGASDANDWEYGDEEEYTDYSSGSSQESDEEQHAARLRLEVWGEAWENLQKVEEGGDGMEDKNPAVASCCVCMEPWESDGPHRLCCIPCGHVYGRSCLEKWLRRCGGTVAKCPQCAKSFERKKIINIYGTKYLWNDCIHDQARQAESERRQYEAFKERMLESERRQWEAFEESMAAERQASQESLEATLAANSLATQERDESQRRQWKAFEEKIAADKRVTQEWLEASFAALAVAAEEKFQAALAALAVAHEEKLQAALAAQNVTCHQMFTAYCVAQGLTPPPMPTLPPLRSPHTPRSSGTEPNEHESSHASPRGNPLGSSLPF